MLTLGGKSNLMSRRAWLAAAAVAGPLASLCGPVTSAARGATERWPFERQLGSVTVHADHSLASSPELLDEIVQLHPQLDALLPLPTPSESVHLLLFRQKATYQTYLKQYYPRVPYRRALYVKERGPGIVFTYHHSELETDLRHEMTHALLHCTIGDVPLWLDEGLAEYFEAPAAKRARDHEYLGATRWQARIAAITRLEDLESLDDLNDMGPQEYQRAWAWVHFCLHGPAEARDDLHRYLQDLAGDVAGPPLSDRLRRRWPDLETKFARHFRGWQ